tara:strand:+ start:4839 stop:6158 length:1320 start_codon:yes stop_codon:yes gene_type:complete
LGFCLHNGAGAIGIHKLGTAVLAKKDVALLTLQSLVCLPVMVFLTKSTVIVLAVTTICGLLYVRSFPQFRPVSAWMLLITTGFVSAIWSITPYQSLERAGKFGIFLVLLAVLMCVVSRWTPKDRHRLSELGLKAWWVALLIALPLIFLETEAKTSIARIFSPDWGIYVLTEQGTHVFKVWKPISNNGVIVLVVTAFPLLGHLMTSGRRKRYLFLSLIGLFAACLASGSSSALLGLVSGLVVWFFYDRCARVTKKVLIIILPLSILTMPILVHPLAKNPESIARNVPNFPNSFIHRLLIWDFTLKRIAERPLLGWGLDTSRAIPGGKDLRPIHFVVPWSDKPITHPDQNLPLHPHNAVLQVWLELGAFGAFVVMLGIWSLLRTQLVSARSGPMAGYIVCAMAVYCVAFGLMQSWWLSLLFLAWAAGKAATPSETRSKIGD